MADDKQVSVISTTKQSKIQRYKVEAECVQLRKAGMSYQEIADELNACGKVPSNDPIDKYVVMRFLDKMPEITKELVKEDKKRLMQVVNTNFDILYEVNHLFGKTKNLLELMEEDAFEKGRFVNPYMYKAVVGEMREMLRQMIDIQKEINDYNNIRKFMEIVLETLHEHVPDKIPLIAEKLKLAKGTQWFADLIQRNKGSEIVDE